VEAPAPTAFAAGANRAGRGTGSEVLSRRARGVLRQTGGGLAKASPVADVVRAEPDSPDAVLGGCPAPGGQASTDPERFVGRNRPDLASGGPEPLSNRRSREVPTGIARWSYDCPKWVERNGDPPGVGAGGKPRLMDFPQHRDLPAPLA